MKIIKTNAYIKMEKLSSVNKKSQIQQEDYEERDFDSLIFTLSTPINSKFSTGIKNSLQGINDNEIAHSVGMEMCSVFHDAIKNATGKNMNSGSEGNGTIQNGKYEIDAFVSCDKHGECILQYGSIINKIDSYLKAHEISLTPDFSPFYSSSLERGQADNLLRD